MKVIIKEKSKREINLNIDIQSGAKLQINCRCSRKRHGSIYGLITFAENLLLPACVDASSVSTVIRSASSIEL